MATLYVIEQGARVEKDYGRLMVTVDDANRLAVPLSQVSEVVVLGRVSVTTPALHALLDAGAGLTLLTQWGKVRGRLQPATGKNIHLRHQQYARAQDGAFCLATARQIVAGKLANYRALARRMARTRPDLDPALIRRIVDAQKEAATAQDLAALRGIEGAGSRSYFQVLRRAVGPGFSFDRRSRRPPRDPFNALLSLGYTLLTENMVAACQIVGLDPLDGFFHSDKYGRPALALDLVEEFRGIIVDSLALTLANREMLAPTDFRPGPEGGIYLTQAGLRIFFEQYSRRVETEVLHPHVGRRLSYRKCFEVQARLLRRFIEDPDQTYRPFRTK